VVEFVEDLIPKMRIVDDLGQNAFLVASDEEIARFKDLSQKLALWCGFALQGFPSLGLKIEDLTLGAVALGVKIGGDVNQYLYFLWHLVNMIRLRGFSGKVPLVKNLVESINGDEVVKAWKLMILSTVASIVMNVEELKKLKNEAEDLPKGLRDFVKVRINLRMAEVYLEIDSRRALEVLKENVEILNNLTIDNVDLKLFEVLSGSPMKKAELSLKFLRSLTHYNLAMALMDLGELEEAIRNFKTAEKIYDKLSFANALKCKNLIEKINFITNGKADFDGILKKAEEKIVLINPLDYSCYIAESVIYRAFEGLKFEEKVMIPEIWRITDGYLAMLGFGDVDKAIKSLEEFEVEVAFVYKLDEILPEIMKAIQEREVDGIKEIEGFDDQTLGFFEEFFKSFVVGVLMKCHERLKRGESIDEIAKGLDKDAIEKLHNEISKHIQLDLDELKDVIDLLFDLANEVIKIFKGIAEVILNDEPITSQQALARILRIYIIGKLEEAKTLAKLVAKKYGPLLSKLFKELANALEIKDEEKIKVSFLKLFYIHF